MRRRAIKLTIIGIAIIVGIGVVCFGGAGEESVESPMSINRLLDNSMSDFEQTAVLDREILSFMRRWELKGASFALMRNDSLLYAKGYGMATDSASCDVSNIFRIASASKLITATAIMKLIEDQRLSLTSQVFGEKGILNDSLFLNLRNRNLEQITVEHLLRHTSGFSSPHGDPAFAPFAIARQIDREIPLSLDDIVLYATQNKLRSRPGGSYDYSNMGYMILSKIVEKCTNLSYESYVQDSILAPIGCYDMFIGHSFNRNKAPNEVQYYEVKEAEPVEAYDGSGVMTMKSDGGNDIALLSGAGGWVASPTELLRFVAHINDCDAKPNILSKESIRKMTYDHQNDKPIGWATIRSGEWLRSGSMAGTTAMIKRQRDGYTWVFLTNSSAWIGYRLGNYISSHISRAVAKVKEWPQRDLFMIEEATTAEIAVEPSKLDER
ncbi:MAG: serine hydrolase domain-containing protein [Rikenellaceae bacterium]